MAGEHVKDAKQATGVRATVCTLRTYTNVSLSFFKNDLRRTKDTAEKDMLRVL